MGLLLWGRNHTEMNALLLWLSEISMCQNSTAANPYAFVIIYYRQAYRH